MDETMSRPCVHRVPHSATCSLDWEECDNCGKGDRVSITDELRHEVANYPFRDNRDFALFEAIADRIDAEHKRLMQEQPFTIDMVPMTDERMAEHGWVRLPVDADGEYIHIGDVMVYADGNTCPMRVVALVPPSVFLTDDGPRYADMCCHKPTTVEDVLREFAERYLDYEGVPSAGRRGIGEALMDEYAAKLRLADDGEEQ